MSFTSLQVVKCFMKGGHYVIEYGQGTSAVNLSLPVLLMLWQKVHLTFNDC
ncbi:hypothetical protein I79_003622 [Cricetulus griseus]|uniref:Uncharacterized protein n=1 Tax=Cricetulus griseus TaxID=10029 RepID=G3H0G6_CRIGR|nr:hypothetical protein I79_003622 [Cricetulus griseus]